MEQGGSRFLGSDSLIPRSVIVGHKSFCDDYLG